MLVLFSFLVTLLRRWRRRRIRGCKPLPGHWLFGNLQDMVRHISKHTHLEYLSQKHSELGLTATWDLPFQPVIVDTACPKNVEHILKTKFDNYVKGSYFRARMTDLLGDGIFNVDGALWHSQRKTASRMFTAKLFREHIWVVVQKNSQKLVRLLQGVAERKEVMDLFTLMNRFTLDTIGEIGFGADIGSLDDPASPFLASFDIVQQVTFLRFIMPFWQLTRLAGAGPERELQKHLALLNDYSLKVVRDLVDKIQGGSEDPSFVGVFLQDAMAKNEKLSEKFLRDMVLNFLIAGRDTTAQALSWTIFLVMGSPKVEQCIVQELLDAFGPPNETNDHESYETISGLPYLQAVINEGLRLFPSVPLDSKIALQDDVLPDGTEVPAGTVVQYNAYAMGRTTEIWGPDALEFRPERWLDMKEPPSPYAYPVFNAGPRECLGKRLAHMEMKACLAFIFRRFKLKLAMDASTVLPSASITIGMSNGLHCSVETRHYNA